MIPPWLRIWDKTFGNASHSSARSEGIQWLMVASMIGLLLVTWQLWSPLSHFPQVPWFSWGCTIPEQLDWSCLSILAASLVCIVWSRPHGFGNRLALFTNAAALVALIMLNQQRTQPWVYQFVLISIVLGSAPPKLAFGLLRLLTVGIYFHSGLSKFNVSFCVGLGRQFWETTLSLMGVAANGKFGLGSWPLMFPAVELLIALGLIWPQTRRVALWFACGMHLGLLFILGPWGLNHRPGVLVWNLFFLSQNLILFGETAISEVTSEDRNEPETLVPNGPATPQDTTVASPAVGLVGTNQTVRQPWRISVARCWQAIPLGAIGAWIASTVVVVALVFPVLEPWGKCDVWMAWGLYAEHGEQLTVVVTASGLGKLPPQWRDAAVPATVESDLDRKKNPQWRLRLKNVSLEKLAAPVYPANRFLLGVTLKIADDARLENDEISAIWESSANRWTGARDSRILANLDEIRAAADRTWFNARPRR